MRDSLTAVCSSTLRTISSCVASTPATSNDSLASATFACHLARRASRMAFIASAVLRSFSRMNAFFTLSAFSYADFAVSSWAAFRARALFSIWSRVAYCAARSSRPP